MGDDSSIVQAARVSYGKDERIIPDLANPTDYVGDDEMASAMEFERNRQLTKDRQLIRYLLSHGHTTPFEMVELKFLVRVPMDCWRQWIRHRTASVNEYSTRYTEAIDSQQTTNPAEWRLQAKDNKQGSGGYLGDWPEGWTINKHDGYWRCIPPGEIVGYSYNGVEPPTPGELLSSRESLSHNNLSRDYQLRLSLGIAKEQARKDLPLSIYTEAYWKCDLHNIFNFLRLRMDSHAQLEIRQYANAMYEIVKQVCPVACEAFEDYVLNAKKFSKMEMDGILSLLQGHESAHNGTDRSIHRWDKPPSMTEREWREFLEKLT
jgi:thymidylate synthase (FAD)